MRQWTQQARSKPTRAAHARRACRQVSSVDEAPDQKLLAWGEDTVGGEKYTLHVKVGSLRGKLAWDACTPRHPGGAAVLLFCRRAGASRSRATRPHECARKRALTRNVNCLTPPPQDIASGRAVSEPIPNTSGDIMWANDNETLVRAPRFSAPRRPLAFGAARACTCARPARFGRAALQPTSPSRTSSAPIKTPNAPSLPPKFYILKDHLDRPYKVMRHR